MLVVWLERTACIQKDRADYSFTNYNMQNKKSNKNKQILISLYLFIHLQHKLKNGRTKKHIKSCLILIYLKIHISGQFTSPTFKALKN